MIFNLRYLALVSLFVLALYGAACAEVRLAVFGDSLTAGYGLPPEESFPAQLEKTLEARGHTVNVINAGVSGDTTAGGLARLGWTLSDAPDAVIVELGGNDALRGIDPIQSRSNLTAILDNNGLQIDGSCCEVVSLGDMGAKWRSFGWEVEEVDGHDVIAVCRALERAADVSGRPSMIIAHTVKGKGVSFMENNVDFHGKAPTPEEMERALKEIEQP